MKLAALTLTIGIVAGAWVTSERYEKRIKAELMKQSEEHAAQLQEQIERAKDYQKISETYYEKYQAASNAEPVTVVDRVYIKADCPVPAAADSGGSLGNGAGYVRAELHAETVARITAVTHRAEQDVKQCRAQLHSLQDKIQMHNKAQ